MQVYQINKLYTWNLYTVSYVNYILINLGKNKTDTFSLALRCEKQNSEKPLKGWD